MSSTSVSSLSSLSGLPTLAESSRGSFSRSERSRGSFAHTTGKSGGRARNNNCNELREERIRTPVPRRPSNGHAGSSSHVLNNSGTGNAASISRNSYSPRSNLRGYSIQRPASSASSSCCNEALPGSPLRQQTTTFQALRKQQTQVQSALRPSSSSSSPTASLPSTPQRSRPNKSVGHDYAFLKPSTSVASSYTSTDHLSSRLDSPYTGSATPSPSPRLYKTLPHRTPSGTPPPAFLIRRGLQRAPPTLAMSIQIHSPSPIMPSSRPMSPPSSRQHRNSRARSPSRSRSRPTSPLQPSAQLPSIPNRPPMARPSSRSERMLRDTLRRAEEHDRLQSLAALPSPSLLGASQPAHGFASSSNAKPRRHVRRNTSSSTGTDASLEGSDYFKPELFQYTNEEAQDADEGGWLWRTRSATSASSSSSGNHPHRTLPPSKHHHKHPTSSPSSVNVRNRSHTDPTGDRILDQFPYGTPTSPPPSRSHLQRSPKSVTNVSRSSHTSLEYMQQELAACGCGPNASLTPHEAVLRSRLEGVLKGAQQHQRRAKSRDIERGSGNASGIGSGSGSGASNSMASSRNMSGEGEWFFGSSADSYTTSLPEANADTHRHSHRPSFNLSPVPRTPSSKHRHHSHGIPSSPSSPSKNALSSPHLHVPLTPPPTPPFNARTAAEQCKHMDGYVSFANIEGLGFPEDLDEGDGEEEDSKNHGRWLKWLSLGGRARNASGAEAAPR
ncbi:unnamed protein product [Somion occarium]|uniref:Uncharacterized protein n=1 Tax=Somion occarium TaxID=3059160 RepID=A0ABP1DH86_9APHY